MLVVHVASSVIARVKGTDLGHGLHVVLLVREGVHRKEVSLPVWLKFVKDAPLWEVEILPALQLQHDVLSLPLSDAALQSPGISKSAHTYQ